MGWRDKPKDGKPFDCWNCEATGRQEVLTGDSYGLAGATRPVQFTYPSGKTAWTIECTMCGGKGQRTEGDPIAGLAEVPASGGEDPRHLARQRDIGNIDWEDVQRMAARGMALTARVRRDGYQASRHPRYTEGSAGLRARLFETSLAMFDGQEAIWVATAGQLRSAAAQLGDTHHTLWANQRMDPYAWTDGSSTSANPDVVAALTDNLQTRCAERAAEAMRIVKPPFVMFADPQHVTEHGAFDTCEADRATSYLITAVCGTQMPYFSEPRQSHGLGQRSSLCIADEIEVFSTGETDPIRTFVHRAPIPSEVWQAAQREANERIRANIQAHAASGWTETIDELHRCAEALSIPVEEFQRARLQALTGTHNDAPDLGHHLRQRPRPWPGGTRGSAQSDTDSQDPALE